MATIAEMLVQGAMQATDAKNTPDILSGLRTGAEIAQKREQLEQSRMQLEQAKQKQENAKFEQVGAWFDTASKMPDGPAKKAFVNDFIPMGINAMGLKDRIDPTVIKMISGDPLIAGVIKEKILSGEMSYAELQRPDAVARLVAENPNLGDIQAFERVRSDYAGPLSKAADERVKMNEQMKRAQTVADAAAQRQQTEIGSKGSVALAQATAKRYEEYQAGGGRAGMESSLQALNEAASALENGKVKTGDITTVIPGFKSDAVQSMINPKLIEVRTQAQAALNNVLRATLGAQFTEAEGERVLKQIWDDKLAPSVNARKIRKKIAELTNNVKNAESEFVKQGLMQKRKSFKDLSPAGQQEVLQRYMQQSGKDEETARKELESR